MNTASLELCKELYELSGWGDTYMVFRYYQDEWNDPIWEKYDVVPSDSDNPNWQIEDPAYDLGYLLRKLPHKTEWGGLFVMSCNDGQWEASYFNFYENWHNHEQYSRRFQEAPSAVADTPENAACKLAIELFKQGILPKQEE